MKILAVVGSPRRNGNTHIVVRKIAEGAKAKGAAVKEIFLGDLTIAECDGCQCCWEAERCSKDDDMQQVYEQIIGSDGFIFGTPVYWYGPTALMKAFVDRFVYFNCEKNRKKIRGKKAVLAVPFEEEDEQTARLVEEFFDKSLNYLEMAVSGKVLVPGVGKKGDVLKKKDKLDEAFGLGSALVTQIELGHGR